MFPLFLPRYNRIEPSIVVRSKLIKNFHPTLDLKEVGEDREWDARIVTAEQIDTEDSSTGEADA